MTAPPAITHPEPHMDHAHLTGLAEEYASAVLARQAITQAVRERLADVAREMRPALIEATVAERGTHAALLAAVESAPELFARPKTRTVGAVRYGWKSGRPSLDIPDPARTIAKIEALPQGQSELLLRRTVSVHKPALLDLTTGDLRRLGVRQIPGADAPFAQPVSDSVDKLVDALLAEAEEVAA